MSRGRLARVLVLLGLVVLVVATVLSFGPTAGVWAAGGALVAVGLLMDVAGPGKGRR